MRKLTKIFLVAFAIGVLLLSGCFDGGSTGVHASAKGFMAEAFMPADTGLFFSYSLRNPEQYALVAEMEKALGEDSGISQLVQSSLEGKFEGIDYEKDFMPAFGGQYRIVFGSRPGNSAEEVDAYSIVTLEDVDAMQTVLDKLVSDGKLIGKQLSSVNAYVNEESNFYGAIYEDLLLISNTPDTLVEMVGMNEDESLWGNDRYQDWMAKIGEDQVFYGVVFTNLYDEDVDLVGGLGVNAASLVTDSQALVVAAAEDGFNFDVYVEGDEEAMKNMGITFDMVSHAPTYLSGEVPATDLMAYYEAYGLKQMYDYVDAAGGSNLFDTLSTFFRSYFAMDFNDEILSFLSKGYVFALHKNGEGLMPGITIYADVSADLENAQKFVSQLSTQIDGLTLVLESALPGAVTSGATKVNGYDMRLLEVDLSSLESQSSSPLPAVLTSKPIKLIFGLMDSRLLITTAEVWENGGGSVADSGLYVNLKDGVEAKDGLILVDTMNTASFAGTLRALREQLELGISEDALGMEQFLEGFEGAIVTSDIGDYDGHFDGFLKIKN